MATNTPTSARGVVKSGTVRSFSKAWSEEARRAAALARKRKSKGKRISATDYARGMKSETKEQLESTHERRPPQKSADELWEERMAERRRRNMKKTRPDSSSLHVEKPLNEQRKKKGKRRIFTKAWSDEARRAAALARQRRAKGAARYGQGSKRAKKIQRNPRTGAPIKGIATTGRPKTGGGTSKKKRMGFKPTWRRTGVGDSTRSPGGYEIDLSGTGYERGHHAVVMQEKDGRYTATIFGRGEPKTTTHPSSVRAMNWVHRAATKRMKG